MGCSVPPPVEGVVGVGVGGGRGGVVAVFGGSGTGGRGSGFVVGTGGWRGFTARVVAAGGVVGGGAVSFAVLLGGALGGALGATATLADSDALAFGVAELESATVGIEDGELPGTTSRLRHEVTPKNAIPRRPTSPSDTSATIMPTLDFFGTSPVLCHVLPV